MLDVLYVEDDDALRELYAEALEEAGFVVRNRRLASAALKDLEENLPDVILLDLGMPPGEMNGIELLARMREHPAWARIPVVILSGFGDLLNPEVTARLGVHRLLTKGAVRGCDVVRAVREAVAAAAAQPLPWAADQAS